MNDFRLKELLEIKNGKDYKHLEDGEIPVYGSGGLMRFVNQYLHNGESILLPRKGTLTNIQYVNEPFWTVDTIYYSIINLEKSDAYYLYNYLNLLDLSHLNSGTGVPSMTFGAYYDVPIKLPVLSEQKKVSKVLRDIDRKIQLNNKINCELEAMAKLIYDYWFIQFDFPISEEQAKALGCAELKGKPYKSSGGKMTFNSQLKIEIPKGWETSTLSRWIDSDKSGDWGKEELTGNYSEKVSCVRGADINGLNGKGTVKSPTRFILQKNSHKMLEEGDFIIEISGGSPTQSTGRMAFIIPETLERFDNPIICSNFCKALKLKDEKSIYNFAYLWNRLYDAGVLFGWEGKTSGIKNLLFESFVTKHNCPKPPKELMEAFYEKATPIHQKIQKNLQENQKLAELRDWLLPMLMNGQVKVN